MYRILIFVIVTSIAYIYFSPPHPKFKKLNIFIENEPTQVDYVTPKIINHADGEHKFLAVAAYSIDARVLSTRRYYFGSMARVSPVDMVLGWKRMSHDDILKDAKVTQSFRKGRVTFSSKSKRDFSLKRQFANVHMIPINDDIEKKLIEVKQDDVVSIRGYLVNVRGKYDEQWKTSTSRTDKGNGACEIILVTHIEKLEIDTNLK